MELHPEERKSIAWSLLCWVTMNGINDKAEVVELIDDGFCLEREVRAAIEGETYCMMWKVWDLNETVDPVTGFKGKIKQLIGEPAIELAIEILTTDVRKNLMRAINCN